MVWGSRRVGLSGADAAVGSVVLELLRLAVAARTGLGAAADGLSWGEQVRGVAGFGIYVMLMALFAAGLAALLGSGVTAIGIMIPFILLASFVFGYMADGLTDGLPDRAGQAVLHETSEGHLGPWSGLLVTFAWTAGVLLAGAWSVRRRDA